MNSSSEAGSSTLAQSAAKAASKGARRPACVCQRILIIYFSIFSPQSSATHEPRYVEPRRLSRPAGGPNLDRVRARLEKALADTHDIPDAVTAITAARLIRAYPRTNGGQVRYYGDFRGWGYAEEREK